MFNTNNGRVPTSRPDGAAGIQDIWSSIYITSHIRSMTLNFGYAQGVAPFTPIPTVFYLSRPLVWEWYQNCPKDMRVWSTELLNNRDTVNKLFSHSTGIISPCYVNSCCFQPSSSKAFLNRAILTTIRYCSELVLFLATHDMISREGIYKPYRFGVCTLQLNYWASQLN